MGRAQRVRWTAAAAVVIAAAMMVGGCSRTIEEEEPPVLVDHRIEPCRKWCEPMLSECGRAADDRPYPTVDACVEDCAGAEPDWNWRWGLQEDGTDACVEEWFLVADCMDALTCEELRRFFAPVIEPYPFCKEELDARMDCFESTPSLDNPEGGQ